MLELEGVFIIHTETIVLRITFGQPPLNVCDSLIAALSCNDFPSQHWGKCHIVQSPDRRYLNVGFFPNHDDSGQVVAVDFVAQVIRNQICFTGMKVHF
jgi:hypothetical protein